VNKLVLEKVKEKTINWGIRNIKNIHFFLVCIKAKIVKEIVINNQKARQFGFPKINLEKKWEIPFKSSMFLNEKEEITSFHSKRESMKKELRNPKKERNKAVFIKSFLGFSKEKAKTTAGKICKKKIKPFEKEARGFILQKELEIINRKKKKTKRTNRDFLKNRKNRNKKKIPTKRERV